MKADKKRIYILSAIVFASLFLVLFVPQNSRIIAAILIAIGGTLALFLLKKRSILSINKEQVLLLMSVIGVLYIVAYYVTGLWFGFVRTYRGLSASLVFGIMLPMAVIVVFSEIFRGVLLAQGDKWASVLAYATCVVAEVLTFSALPSIRTFNNFMDVLGLYFVPALAGNILYHYLSKRYGAYPNMVYRLLIALFPYIIALEVGLPDSLYAFAKLILPLIILWFIDVLFEKKKRVALQKNNKLSYVGMCAFICALAGYVMLISCQFTFGMFIIGSESMTGELNKGDAVIYKEYDEQVIELNQIIVFSKNGGKVIHRVVNIERINGKNRYITKGDANQDADGGYITDEQIIGVASFKIPYVGYPTLWLRGLF